MDLIAYLVFEGNAEEAMETYARALGGSVSYVQRYGEAEGMPNVSENWKDKILHAEVTIGKSSVYISDNLEGRPVSFGNSVSLNVNFDSEETLRAAFKELSAGGTVNMEVQETFWNAIYGSLTDQFGMNWGLNYSLPSK